MLTVIIVMITMPVKTNILCLREYLSYLIDYATVVCYDTGTIILI